MVGNLAFSDEDTAQTHTLVLLDDDNGQFSLKGKQLVKAKSTDYETKTAHKVTVKVTDSGTPPFSVSA